MTRPLLISIADFDAIEKALREGMCSPSRLKENCCEFCTTRNDAIERLKKIRAEFNYLRGTYETPERFVLEVTEEKP